MDPGFFIQILVNGLVNSGIYIIVSLGLALSVGVLGILNISHGNLLIFTTYLTYWFWRLWGLDPLMSLLITVPTGFVLGALIYRGVIKQVLQAPHINQLILTFGIAVVLSSLMEFFWSSNVRFVSTEYQAVSISLGMAQIGSLSVAILLLAFTVCLILHLFLTKTDIGKSIRAVSQNPKGAALVGIDVDRIYLVSFGVSIALGSFAGVFWLLIGYITPYVGDILTLKAFSIIVVAGLGNLYGVIWASLLLGLSESFVKGYFGPGWADAVFFGIIMLVLIYRSFRTEGDS